MRVLIRDVITAVRHGEAALVGESCGYLVLGAADLALQLPRVASPESVSFTSEGELHLDGSPVTHVESERSLRLLLGELLRFVRTACPNLLRVAQRKELMGLEFLVRELEAALIPVNRRAARRSMGRLAREVERSSQHARLHSEVVEVLETSEPFLSAEAKIDQLDSPLAEIVESIVSERALTAVTSDTEVEAGEALAEALPSASLTIDPIAFSKLLTAQFGEQTPDCTSDIESRPIPTAATEEFDELLDDCETQVFVGVLLESCENSESLLSAADGCRPTLTPPLPTQASETETPIVQVATLDLVTTPEPLEIWNFSHLVTGPSQDPLILSPCAPAVLVDAPSVLVNDANQVQILLQPESESESETEIQEEDEALETGTVTPESAFTPAIESVTEDISAIDLRPRTGPSRRHQPLFRARIRVREPIADNVSLIPNLDQSPRRRPSDIRELLDRRLVASKPDAGLYLDLQALSQVGLSPIAPQVALVKL